MLVFPYRSYKVALSSEPGRNIEITQQGGGLTINGQNVPSPSTLSLRPSRVKAEGG